MFVCFLLYFFLSGPQFAEAGTKGDGSDWDVPDARTAVPGQERALSSRFALTKGTVCTVPLCFLVASQRVLLFFALRFDLRSRLSW